MTEKHTFFELRELLGIDVNYLKMDMCIIGSDGVGKTSLTKKANDPKFALNTAHPKTRHISPWDIGWNPGWKDVRVGDENICLMIRELDSAERFRHYWRTLIKGSKSIIFCFDLARPQTLVELLQGMMKQALACITEPIVSVLLVGCKNDLIEGSAEPIGLVEDARNHIRQIVGGIQDIPFIKTSALTGFNTDNVFKESLNIYLKLATSRADKVMKHEEVVKERALLLTRFFRPEELFRIGQELGLSYFKRFSSYLNMDLDQATKEIADNIDDDRLIDLTTRHVPRYGLIFGGFHGNYYTASEAGEVRLKSSWKVMRENVQGALERWGDGAYGVLWALIKKNGISSYPDLIDVTRSILGYEIVPSDLLAKLGSLRLVFKMGSREYPDWRMPPEIVPVIAEELDRYRRPINPYFRQALSDRVLNMERRIGALVDNMVEARRALNLAFKDKFKTVLFRQDERAINDIRKPCSSEEEFNSRIMYLSLLIDQIETEKVRELIRSTKPKEGSINLIEALLQELVPDFDKDVITSLRKIVSLRSNRSPAHPDNPALLEGLRYFEVTAIPPDWQELWERVLQRYLGALRSLSLIIDRI